LLWITAAGLLTGLLGSLLLRAIRTPLRRVVEQAAAITERRFTSITVPRIPELKNHGAGAELHGGAIEVDVCRRGGPHFRTCNTRPMVIR
jgi:hypothetical protein